MYFSAQPKDIAVPVFIQYFGAQKSGTDIFNILHKLFLIVGAQRLGAATAGVNIGGDFFE